MTNSTGSLSTRREYSEISAKLGRLKSFSEHAALLLQGGNFKHGGAQDLYRLRLASEGLKASVGAMQDVWSSLAVQNDDRNAVSTFLTFGDCLEWSKPFSKILIDKKTHGDILRKMAAWKFPLRDEVVSSDCGDQKPEFLRTVEEIERWSRDIESTFETFRRQWESSFEKPEWQVPSITAEVQAVGLSDVIDEVTRGVRDLSLALIPARADQARAAPTDAARDTSQMASLGPEVLLSLWLPSRSHENQLITDRLGDTLTEILKSKFLRRRDDHRPQTEITPEEVEETLLWPIARLKSLTEDMVRHCTDQNPTRYLAAFRTLKIQLYHLNNAQSRYGGRYSELLRTYLPLIEERSTTLHSIHQDLQQASTRD